MRNKLLKILIPSLVIVAAILINGGFPFNKNFTVQAVGDLVITWGVAPGDPIFVVSNLLPGDSEERDVEVENNASSSRSLGVRGIKTSETGNISEALNIEIKEGSTTLYGPTPLDQFFTDSSTLNGIPLSTLGPSDSATYKFIVTFDLNAGNEFQDNEVIFDLQIGISMGVPNECKDIDFSGDPIFGTDEDDRINGTTGNDLIFVLEGNDRVLGFGGDDCIVGGSGNDELRGETGNDILIGNEGNDLLIGGVDEDKIFGGEGNDDIRGENDDDYIEGGDGNDVITGGNGEDEIHGGEGHDNISSENGEDSVFGDSGNDSLDGGSGDDYIEGNDGNDNIAGKAGDDNLVGGANTDTIDGLSGTDTCDGEVELNCEI